MTRPKSFSLGSRVTVRRDARRAVWRVFLDSRRVYSTAGADAQDRAMAYGLVLAEGAQPAMPTPPPGGLAEG